MNGRKTARNRGRFKHIFMSYLIIALVPLLLGLIVFQRAVHNLEDSYYRFHRQLLQEYRQVTDAVLSGAKNTVMRLTWDDKVKDLGRAGRVESDPDVTFLVPEVAKYLEKIVSLESSYLDIAVYAAASDAVATSQFSFVNWDRFYGVFFEAEGMTSEAFRSRLEAAKTIRFVPLSIRKFIGGRWTSQDVLLYAMDFPIVGTPMGKVLALLSLDRLTQPMKKLAAQGVDSMLILDGSGQKIASIGNLTGEALDALREKALSMTPNAPALLTAGGRRMLAIMEPSQAHNLRFVTFVEYDNLFGVVLAVRNAMYALVAACILLIFGSAAYFARRQANQYNDLALKTDEMEKWLDAQKAGLADVFVDKLLRDEFPDEAAMRDFARRIDLPDMPGAVGIVVVRLDLLSRQEEARNRVDLGKLLLNNLLAEKKVPHYTSNLDDRRVAVIAGGFATPDAFAAFAEETVATLPERFGQKLDLGVTAAATRELSALMDAHAAFRRSAYLLDDTQRPGLHWVQSETESRDEIWYPFNQEEIILSSVRKGGTGQLTAALDRVYQMNLEQRALKLPMYQQLIAMLCGTATRCLQACDDPALPTDAMRGALQEIGAQGSVALAFAQVRRVLTDLSEAVRIGRLHGGARQMDEILRYIEERLADSNLGLAAAAAHFRLSEPYLSRIFKEINGVNYSEYVESRRIARACEMLSQGTPIQQVAGDVGYNSVSVFRNAFKRVTGVTPGSYCR